ncbi:MAG TPA: hypothetical protein VEJ38_12490 [Candidatus Acidoferrales bacterium]|nr:hypothetical protein [Candidatus Acidoferrales bacterium]
MPSYRISDIPGVRLLLLSTIAVVAFGYVAEPAAKAQSAPTPGTTWVVTVDVTTPNPIGGPEVPSYSIATKGLPPNSPPPPTCGASSTALTLLGDVPVCPGDTIYWQAKTSNGKGVITVDEVDGVLHSGSNSPHWFHGNVGDLIGGITSSSHPQRGGHDYVVAVYDSGLNKVVVDDPKIIVGSGNGNLATSAVLLTQIQQSVQLLSDQVARVLKDDPKALEEANGTLRRMIEDVDKLQRIPQLK